MVIHKECEREDERRGVLARHAFLRPEVGREHSGSLPRKETPSKLACSHERQFLLIALPINGIFIKPVTTMSPAALDDPEGCTGSDTLAMT